MGRPEEFTEFAGARWISLVRSAVFLGCSLDEAEDLAQTAQLKCYLSWSKVRRADDQDAYVFRVLLNSLRDSKRRRWWGEQPTDEVPDPSQPDATHDLDTSDAVERALGALSAEQRAVVVLRFFAHLTERQTAIALGIAPGTVKSRTSRALASLADNPHLADLAEGIH